MKILYILGQFPVISETFILNEITSLIDLGHDIEIISLGRPKGVIFHAKAREYDLINKTMYLEFNTREGRKKYSKKGLLLKTLTQFLIGSTLSLKNKINLLHLSYEQKQGKEIALRKILDYLTIIKVIRETKPGVVYCHFGTIANQIIKLKSIINFRLVTYFHGFDFSLAPKRGIDYSLLFKKGDLFLTNSNYAKGKLIELGCPEDRLSVIGLGIDLEKFKFKIRSIGDTVKLLTVARLVEKKGLKYSIEAVANSIKKHNNIIYNIIGEGPLRAELGNLIKSKGLEDKIFLLGAKTNEEVLSYMLESDIFILSSVTADSGDTEGLGVILLEAQATGMPVLATLHNGFPEAVRNGKSGFLVPEKDINALSERINYLVENPQIWKELGEEGRKHIFENYSQKKVINRLVAAVISVTSHFRNTAKPSVKPLIRYF